MSLLYSVLCTFEQQVKIFLEFDPVVVHLLPSRLLNFSMTFSLASSLSFPALVPTRTYFAIPTRKQGYYYVNKVLGKTKKKNHIPLATCINETSNSFTELGQWKQNISVPIQLQPTNTQLNASPQVNTTYSL